MTLASRLLLPILVLLALAGAPSQASALSSVVQDDALLLSGDQAKVDGALSKAEAIGFTHVRLTANWQEIAPDAASDTQPIFDAKNSASYPAGVWDRLDLAVRAVRAHHMEPMIDIGFWAPYWATTEPVGSQGIRARENVDPSAFSDFAEAVVRRYHGDFVPAAGAARSKAGATSAATGSGAPQVSTRGLFDALFGGGKQPAPAPTTTTPAAPAKPVVQPLPAVNTYTLWNEPNIKGFLTPQWKKTKKGRKPASPGVYRRMLTAAYPRVKAISPNATFLIGATSSTGSYALSGLHGGVPPLQFIRELACVDAKLKPIRKGACKGFTQLPGDGWAHHPYSFETGPSNTSADGRPDDAILGDTAKLHKLLTKLAARKRITWADSDLYLTEYGYFTTVIGTHRAVTEPEQAKLVGDAFRLASQFPGVKMMSQFLLQDVQCDGGRTTSCLNWTTGLMHTDGTPKPLLGVLTDILHSLVPEDAGR
ncbi:hypothetical protein [Patulibacter minatonensis]|uniref:hypothetical protein n=1 Tax=Patulibacter minatonensis TaxID=298163 RepID=UPI00047B1A1B|nr:hypothetical protein [Patulibacter minatonensis]